MERSTKPFLFLFRSGFHPVAQTNNQSRRIYDKKYFCIFCGNLYCKLTRHLVNIHSNEKEVMAYRMASDKLVKENILTKIRNTGAYKHNSEVIKTGIGQLQVKYRTNRVKTEQDYSVCECCSGYFLKHSLWKHVIWCEQRHKAAESKTSLVTHATQM